MTTIRTRGHGGMLRLISRWLGRRQPGREAIEYLAPEGVSNHLLRDLGLSPHCESYPRRDVRR